MNREVERHEELGVTIMVEEMLFDIAEKKR